MRKVLLLLLTVLITVPVFSQSGIRVAFRNLQFTAPVDLASPNDGTDRIFVVSQAGRIFVFPNDENVPSSKTFLDISDRVIYSGEQGLLGIAFHPKYKTNGYFYVNYVANNPRRTVIARYQVSSSNPDSAVKASEQVVLTFTQPYSNHNGGQVAFGPDGYLYIATGDGGSGGDPQNNSQNRSNLLGKILRIDIDNPAGSLNYGIPVDNPFAGNTQGFSQEIYAYGLRNPWRFSFDKVTGLLWCADVGQNKWEEINLIENGGNYGWRIMEGTECYNPSTGCNTAGLILPIHQYFHNSTGGYSVSGGFVYRGGTVPELTGKYIYADYVSKRVWALTYNGTGNVTNELLSANIGISIAAFGVDNSDELYLLDLSGGKIYRFAETVDVNTGGNSGDSFRERFYINQNYPNPFNPSTNISFGVLDEGEVTVKIVDLLGNELTVLENSFMRPGEYSRVWAADNFSSGVYFVQLTGVSAIDGKVYTSTKKIILNK